MVAFPRLILTCCVVRSARLCEGTNADMSSALQIVANGRNGLDVDKFDYLQRDSLYCNVKINADFDRLQKFSKVSARVLACSFIRVDHVL